jgi:hypothetical protein
MAILDHFSLLQYRIVGSLFGVGLALCLVLLSTLELGQRQRRCLIIVSLLLAGIFGVAVLHVQRSIRK